jgi:glycosyltransferase 2 family protein
VSVAASRRRILLPRRRGDLVQLLIAAAVLVISALPIERAHVGTLESDIFHVVNRLPDAAYWPVWVVMQLGNLAAVPATALAAVAARRGRLALDLVLAGGAAYVLAKVVKVVVYRGRPGQLLDDVILRHAPAAGHGFVAGHAATVSALAAAALPYLGRRGRWIVVAVAALVCVGRVYVGAHLPLDVVGGAALGWFSGALVHLALGSPGPRPRPERGSRTGPVGAIRSLLVLG